jgi:hypothetical protein
MKTLALNLKAGKTTVATTLPITKIITLDKAFVDLSVHLENETTGALFRFTHQHNSHLNLTNVSPYVLLFFNDTLDFVGATHSIKNGTGEFTVKTPYKHILLVKMPHSLTLKSIISLSITNI